MKNIVANKLFVFLFVIFLFLVGYLFLFPKKTKEESILKYAPLEKLSFTCDDFFQEPNDFHFSQKYQKYEKGFKLFVKKFGFSGDGHSGTFPAEYKLLHYYAGLDWVSSACETGFNYGHSSFSFLTAKNNKVLSFDIGGHNYIKPIMGYLNETFPNKFTGVLGDSSISLPKFVENHPQYKCNVFFVDGSHTYKVGYSDLKSFSKMASPENVVVFDDFPTLDNSFVNKLGKAWEQAKQEGFLEEILRCTRSTEKIRGFCIGRFIPPIKK